MSKKLDSLIDDLKYEMEDFTTCFTDCEENLYSAIYKLALEVKKLSDQIEALKGENNDNEEA